MTIPKSWWTAEQLDDFRTVAWANGEPHPPQPLVIPAPPEEDK